MYEVTCWQGLVTKFLSRKGAIRYAIELQDSGVRHISVWNLDTRQPMVREFLETRSDLIRQLRAIEGVHRVTTTAAELRRRVAELDEFLAQA